jgi:hypothetical protein
VRSRSPAPTALFAILLVQILGGAKAVASEPCAAATAPSTTLVAIDVASGDEHLARDVEAQLGAALASRGIGLCTGPGGQANVVGRVSIRLETAGVPPVAQIHIGDEVTRKQVERSLELGLLPPDGWALAIASSADELLRASWAELMLRDAPPPPRAAPPLVAEAVSASARRSARRVEIGLDGGGSAGRARSAVSVAARAGFAVLPHVALTAAATSSLGAARASTHGSVRQDDVGGEAGLAVGLEPVTARRGLRFEAGVSLLRVFFAASAAPGADALSFTDWSAVSTARARGWVSLGSYRLFLAGGVSYPIRASRALDGDALVTSNEGLTVLASLGFGIGY